jgi:cell division septal protein FtsQ
MLHHRKTFPIKHRRKILILAVLLIGLAIFAIFSPKILYARIVECYTQHGVCPEEWLTNLTTLQNTPLLFPLPRTQAATILKKFTQVESVRLYRRLPSTLVVLVQVRSPLGLVGPTSQVLGVADENGIVFSLAPNLQLPHLVTSNSPQLQQKITPLEIMALKALNTLTPFSNNQISGELDNTSLSVQLTKETLVVIDVKKNPSSWTAPLQLILDRSKISPKVPAKIDLRFTNPVISYN